MNSPSSYQNCQPKIVVSNSSSSTSSSDSYEFDLHQLYHNAVECLINADQTIKSLRKQSTSKDEQIAMLEEKIVQMSLELASSKEMQDEQTQQLHRMKRRISTAGLDDDDVGECAPRRQISKKVHVSDSQPSLVVDYSPIRYTRKNKADCIPFVEDSSIPMENNNVNASLQRRTGRQSSLNLNDSSSTRRLSNFGHFFKGLNNRNVNCATTTAAQEDMTMKNTKNEVSISNGEINFEGRMSCRRRQSLDSLVSIEGVIFPVSSQEVLDVCKRTSFGSDNSSRRVSDCANEEWPEFR